MDKYTMSLDLNVLNHLGLNLYSNTPAVLSEVVANSYDADATEVHISISQDNDEIIITDNGNGMSLDEVNGKFLCVGYQKRKNGEALSRKYERPVMGRKGIGKLSLLSIADIIEIHTKTVNGDENSLLLSKVDLEYAIDKNDGVYHPQNIDFIDFERDHGTRIIIKNFRKEINRTPVYLKPRLARRFSIDPQISKGFDIYVNEDIISIEDRNFFSKIEFLWHFGDLDNQIREKHSTIKYFKLDNSIKNTEYVVSGWIATVDKPSDLKQDKDNNNKISIICRGKLAQEDILSFFNEGGLYSSYIIGELHADFLDNDEERDIATSNRQQLNENDFRFQCLQSFVYDVLKIIQKQWTSLRNEISVSKATSEIPALAEWYELYKGDAKEQAKKLFASIENLHFDKNIEKKKEIYKFGILAFERLRVADKLSELNRLDGKHLTTFGSIFSEMQDIEAALYYDIASQRVSVIKKIVEDCDNNEKEKIIQKHLFDNLWLLDASWDRATSGTERIEQIVKKEFDKITVKLSDDEKKGRVDIRYKTSAGKHIIIEMKRYNATYKITKFTLSEQVEKYIKALSKCLVADGAINPHIEAICLVGPNAVDDINDANKFLNVLNARIMTYDQLISHAQESYSDYLERNKEVGKIRKLIDGL